jgi:hypothetical protein
VSRSPRRTPCLKTRPSIPPRAATADFLASLAGAGPVLELAIGTGRIALPLAARGLQVHWPQHYVLSAHICAGQLPEIGAACQVPAEAFSPQVQVAPTACRAWTTGEWTTLRLLFGPLCADQDMGRLGIACACAWRWFIPGASNCQDLWSVARPVDDRPAAPVGAVSPVATPSGRAALHLVTLVRAGTRFERGVWSNEWTQPRETPAFPAVCGLRAVPGLRVSTPPES